jgi:hypothetical protein
MTTPAIAIRNEIRNLIQEQIAMFGQLAPLTSSELEDCHCRTERIKLLGEELDRVGRMAIRLADANSLNSNTQSNC